MYRVVNKKKKKKKGSMMIFNEDEVGEGCYKRLVIA
jgi:hypothetical protein